MTFPSPQADPHAGAPVFHAGAQLSEASAAVLMIHGRGAMASDILELSRQLPAGDTCYLAPQAANSTWYPHRFLEPIERNEPFLSSALSMVRNLVDQVSAAGIPSRRIAIVGFSQGACLALEFAARHPRRYGGVFGLSGGLIGPPGTVWPDHGSLEGTPIFIGCSDVDSHIPVSRVMESGERLRALGAAVDVRIYPGMGHTINRDEIAAMQHGLSSMIEIGSTSQAGEGQ